MDQLYENEIGEKRQEKRKTYQTSASDDELDEFFDESSNEGIHRKKLNANNKTKNSDKSSRSSEKSTNGQKVS